MSLSPATDIDAQRACAGSKLGRFRSSNLKRWLREPLLHFLLIGAFLFGIYAYQNHRLSGVEPSKQIVLSLDNLRVMEAYFESRWQRPPTPQEFQAIVEDNVREEVLYREGLAMGLDKDDTIVKRRMAQKMQFLAEDVAAAHEPSTVELKSWFDKNKEKFALPILLGAAVLFELRPTLPIAATLVGVFAIFHGHAHGTELPPGQSAMLYSMGFVIATGCLHAVGIGVGTVHRWDWGSVRFGVRCLRSSRPRRRIRRAE